MAAPFSQCASGAAGLDVSKAATEALQRALERAESAADRLRPCVFLAEVCPSEQSPFTYEARIVPYYTDAPGGVAALGAALACPGHPLHGVARKWYAPSIDGGGRLALFTITARPGQRYRLQLDSPGGAAYAIAPLRADGTDPENLAQLECYANCDPSGSLEGGTTLMGKMLRAALAKGVIEGLKLTARGHFVAALVFCCDPPQRRLHIVSVATHSAGQRRGYATALVRAALDAGRARGLQEATLEVTSCRRAVLAPDQLIAWYERLGFRAGQKTRGNDGVERWTLLTSLGP